MGEVGTGEGGLLSGAGSSVSPGLQEARSYLLLLLQEAEWGSAVGPCPGRRQSSQAEQQTVPGLESSHTDASRQRTTQLSPSECLVGKESTSFPAASRDRQQEGSALHLKVCFSLMF